MDWFVYHSTLTMGEPYAALGESAAFSTNEQPKLAHGDTVGVIEGPGDFALVDTFKVARTDTPPRFGRYARFKLKVTGDRSLLTARHSLSLDLPWFKKLHGSYLTKQRFFGSLASEPEVVAGLRGVCPDAT